MPAAKNEFRTGISGLVDDVCWKVSTSHFHDLSHSEHSWGLWPLNRVTIICDATFNPV